ncbi:phage DNA packaging protein J [Streptomyces lavendulocolor]
MKGKNRSADRPGRPHSPARGTPGRSGPPPRIG